MTIWDIGVSVGLIELTSFHHKYTVICNTVRQDCMSKQWFDNTVTQVQSPDLSTSSQFSPQKATMFRKSLLFPSLGPPRPQVHQFRYSAHLHLISHQTHAKQTVLLSSSLISRWFRANAFDQSLSVALCQIEAAQYVPYQLHEHPVPSN